MPSEMSYNIKAHLKSAVFALFLLFLSTPAWVAPLLTCKDLVLLKVSNPIEMRGTYRGEHRGPFLNWLLYGENAPPFQNIRYLKEREKRPLEILVRDGLLVDPDGDPKFTDGKEIFVLDELGRLFSMKGQHNGVPAFERRLSHSSLSFGRPVFMAGEIEIVDGQVVKLSNSSGHYGPTSMRFYVFIKSLERLGVDLSKTQIHLDARSGEALEVDLMTLQKIVESERLRFNFTNSTEAMELNRIRRHLDKSVD